MSRYKLLIAGLAICSMVAIGASTTREHPPHPVKVGGSIYDFTGLQETVAYAVAVQTAQYLEALEAARVAALPHRAGGAGGNAGGRYVRGCPGGESACIPTALPCVIPQYICDRESSAINKYNYQGSGASGKYQVLHSTWDGYAGYDNAADAPEEVQDAWAREAYAAAGCRPWAAKC